MSDQNQRDEIRRLNEYLMQVALMKPCPRWVSVAICIGIVLVMTAAAIGVLYLVGTLYLTHP